MAVKLENWMKINTISIHTYENNRYSKIKMKEIL